MILQIAFGVLLGFIFIKIFQFFLEKMDHLNLKRISLVSIGIFGMLISSIAGAFLFFYSIENGFSQARVFLYPLGFIFVLSLSLITKDALKNWF